MAFATTLAVIQPSSARREAVGDPSCGGTVYAHVAYAEQAAIKREVLRDALRHGGRIEWPGDLPVSSSPEHGYRMRARLHVRKGRVGFFREGTHELCDCAGTGQLLPASVEAVRAFVDATPRAVRDAIDAIELTESIAADERVLHVLWAPHARVNTLPLDEIWRLDRHRRVVVSVTNVARVASVTGVETHRLTGITGITGISCDDPSTGLARTVSGQPWVSDPLDALVRSAASASLSATRLRRHAASFFQANRYLVPDLVAAACTALSAAALTGRSSISTRASACSRSRWRLCVQTHRSTRPSSPSKAIHRARATLAANAETFSGIQVEHSSVEHYLDRFAPAPRRCRHPPR